VNDVLTFAIQLKRYCEKKKFLKEVRRIDSKKFHMDLNLLEALVKNVSENVQHRAGQPQLIVYVNAFPNGKQELVFEQPCIYRDGASKFHRVAEREAAVC
jgi:hypothetical protein